MSMLLDKRVKNMLIQQTSIGWYEGRLAGQKSFVLFPTREVVISALCQLVEALNYDDGEGNNGRKVIHLDFTYREEQALKRLPELRFNPKKKDSITDKIMNKIIWG